MQVRLALLCRIQEVQAAAEIQAGLLCSDGGIACSACSWNRNFMVLVFWDSTSDSLNSCWRQRAIECISIVILND
jgi:hypothetical protein